jgi:hypothetical protein
MFNSPFDTPSNNEYDPAQIIAGTGLLNKIFVKLTSSSGFNVTVRAGLFEIRKC